MSAGTNGITVTPANGAGSGIYAIEFCVRGATGTATAQNMAFGVSTNGTSSGVIVSSIYGLVPTATSQFINGRVIVQITGTTTLTLINMSTTMMGSADSFVLDQLTDCSGNPIINASLYIFQIA